MFCREIIETIEKRYPVSCALDWDHVGLLVGSRDREVRTVYVALDALDEVIGAAAHAHADMLITHHPLLFSPLRQVTEEDFIGRRVIRLIREEISYYAMHTNYDVMGMAELAGEVMGFSDPEVLEITCPEGAGGGRPEGIGRVADLERPLTLRECCAQVKERFALEAVKVFGDPDSVVRRAAISPGSGKSMITAALDAGAEVLITGDIDHHTGIDAQAQGLSIIDGGHYGIEKIFVRDMANFLRGHFPELTVLEAPPCDPFRIV